MRGPFILFFLAVGILGLALTASAEDDAIEGKVIEIYRSPG